MFVLHSANPSHLDHEGLFADLRHAAGAHGLLARAVGCCEHKPGVHQGATTHGPSQHQEYLHNNGCVKRKE